MKSFLVLLAVVAVFADPRSDSSSEDSQQEVDKPFYEGQPEIDESFDESQEVEKSFEDSQQEIGTLNIEDDDDGNQQAVIPTSTHLCSINVPALVRLIYRVINRKLASQPGKSIYKHNCSCLYFKCSCADALSIYWWWKTCIVNSKDKRWYFYARPSPQ